MNLLSLKRELEQLKALARARCGSGCVCEYVEIIEDESLRVAEERLVTNNRACYERRPDRNWHVGFSSIIVPRES
jgi:hypothetical protein